MNENHLNVSKNYNMFNQILIANTGYTNGKKIYKINCNNLSQDDINHEYTTTVITGNIELPYELIGMEGQQIKPCFDCDPKFDKNGEIDVLKTIQDGIKKVDKLYPDNTKYAYYRVYDIDDNKTKVSFHTIVDGIRTNSKTILHKLESNNFKKNEPFDHSIYSLNRGLYPCFTDKKVKGWDKNKFEIFYTKPFIPICLETGKDLKWADIDIRKYCASYVEESFVMDFIEPPSGPIEPKEEKKQYDNHNILKNNNDDIKDLISCLNVERVEDYQDWLNIGMILKNIDNDNFDLWCEWSSNSKKYDYKICKDKWHSFKRSGLTIASLKYYAKLDNPTKYKEITYNSITDYINKSVASSGSHLDIAYLCSYILKDLVIYDNTTKFWFMIDEITNIWIKDEKGTKLSIKIGLILSDIFMQHCNYLTKLGMEEQDVDKKTAFIEKVKEVCKVSIKVKNNNYRKSILTDLQGLLCDDDIFENKLDTKINLFAFNNGVLDLDNNIFRKIQYCDYIHTTTGYDYNPNIDKKYTTEINSFFESIQSDVNVRKYLIDVLSCRLYGKNIHQEFYINTGNGSNGKSVLFNLIQCGFGKYSSKMRSEVFTKSSRGANETSGLAHTRNTRIIQVEEPDTQDKLIVSRLKEISGDSSIEVRGLYQNPFEFIPKFGVIFYCNEIPGLSKADKATGRRLRIIPFDNKFVDNPDPNNPNEKQKDNSLNIKFKQDEQYIQAFMKILFDNWTNSNLTQKLTTPDIVIKHSNNYMDDADIVKTFINENYELDETKESKISASDLFNHFKRLNKDIMIDRKGFAYSVENLFSKDIKTRTKKGIVYFLEEKENDDN